MNKALSLVLLSALGDLPYIDKSCGVVQVLSRPFNVNGETVYKKIPVSTLATSQDCSANDTSAIEMIPDANYKGMLYFEERGTGLGVRRGSTQQYRSDIRLVCWLNTLKINGGVADMTFSMKAMNDIINHLVEKEINSLPFINIGVTVSRIPEANANLFPYDYDPNRTLFLFSPYDFFAIDLLVTFNLGKGCKPDINVVDAPKC